MKLSTFFLSLVALVATGCAITPPVSYTPDGKVQTSVVVITPGVDGTAITVASICVVKDAQPDPAKRETVTDSEKCEGGFKVSQFASTPTAAGVITNTVPVVAGQYVQGVMAKSVVRENGRNCKEGGCVPGTLVQNQNLVSSEATSGSVNDVKIDANIGARLPCAATNSCGTAGK